MSKDELREALDKWKPIFVNEVIPSEFVDAILNLLEGEKVKAVEQALSEERRQSVGADLHDRIKSAYEKVGYEKALGDIERQQLATHNKEKGQE